MTRRRERLEETLASQRSIRVLIVDDEPLFRLGLAMTLADDERLEFVLSEAGHGEAGLARIAAEEPEIVLLDLQMPRLATMRRQIKRDRRRRDSARPPKSRQCRSGNPSGLTASVRS